MMVSAVFLAAALSSGNAEFDNVAREGAREIALTRAAEEIAEKGPPAGVLEKAMLADPGKFAKAENAKRLCKEVFEREAEAAFAAKAKAIDARLDLGSSRVGIGSDRVGIGSDRVGIGSDSVGIGSDRVGIGSDRVDAIDSNVTLKDPKRPYLAIGKVVERHFEKAFENERRSAVEKQAKGLVAATRPAECDFDKMDDATLRAAMLERILKEQKTPVFEENRQFVSERMVDPVIADARREQKRQAEYLMRARTDAYAPSALKRDLRARLEDNVKDRRAKADDPAKAWGVFEGTFDRSVDAAVERRVLVRIERRVDSFEVNVDAESVLKAMAENPSVHVKTGESETIFRARYSSEMLSGAVAAACAEAPEQEREEFGAYARKHLDANRITKAVEQRLQKDVLPKWRKARAEAAARQAAETWPGLEDGTWHPGPDLADETAARSDYAAAVHNWRRAKGMEPLAEAAKGRSVLEEADKRADAKVAAAFDLARSAIAAQNKIVEGCHTSVLEESRRRKDSFWTRTPDLKAVTELLTKATEGEWEKTRLSTLWPDVDTRPGNAAEQHRELFPSVRRKIELLAKVILEEMNEPRPKEEKKPDDPPQEDESGEIQPSAKPGEPRPPRIAFQVYAVRDLCEKDFAGTLKAAKAMGYEGVETGRFYGLDAKGLKAACDDAGLELVALQLYPHNLTEPQLGETIRFCRECGCRRVNVAWYKGSEENPNDWQLLVNVLNHAAEVCAKEGIFVAYHNHDHEFRMKLGGRTVWDWLYAEDGGDAMRQVTATPRFSRRVLQELDCGNCVLGGGDPVTCLAAHPHRNPTVHVMPAIANVKCKIENGKCNGCGVGSERDMADWNRIIPALVADGVEWLVVKPTAHPDSLADLKASIEYLRRLLPRKK